MTSTPRDEDTATWAESPRMSRRDRADDRGYNPSRDDNAPPAAHMAELDPEWTAALDNVLAFRRKHAL